MTRYSEPLYQKIYFLDFISQLDSSSNRFARVTQYVAATDKISMCIIQVRKPSIQLKLNFERIYLERMYSFIFSYYLSAG